MKNLILFCLLFLLLFSGAANAQRTTDKLTHPCPRTPTRAVIEFNELGDINLKPCPNRQILNNGLNVGTAPTNLQPNFIPYWDGQNFQNTRFKFATEFTDLMSAENGSLYQSVLSSNGIPTVSYYGNAFTNLSNGDILSAGNQVQTAGLFTKNRTTGLIASFSLNNTASNNQSFATVAAGKITLNAKTENGTPGVINFPSETPNTFAFFDSGKNLKSKNIVAGTGITFADSPTDLTLNVANPTAGLTANNFPLYDGTKLANSLLKQNVVSGTNQFLLGQSGNANTNAIGFWRNAESDYKYISRTNDGFQFDLGVRTPELTVSGDAVFGGNTYLNTATANTLAAFDGNKRLVSKPNPTATLTNKFIPYFDGTALQNSLLQFANDNGASFNASTAGQYFISLGSAGNAGLNLYSGNSRVYQQTTDYVGNGVQFQGQNLTAINRTNGSFASLSVSTQSDKPSAEINLTAGKIVFSPQTQNGAAGAVVFSNSNPKGVLRLDASSNLTSTPLSNGQLLIGNTNNDATAANLTAGTGISITNAAGAITIANTAANTTAGLNTNNFPVWNGSAFSNSLFAQNIAAGTNQFLLGQSGNANTNAIGFWRNAESDYKYISRTNDGFQFDLGVRTPELTVSGDAVFGGNTYLNTATANTFSYFDANKRLVSKSILAGTGISIANNANDITISSNAANPTVNLTAPFIPYFDGSVLRNSALRFGSAGGAPQGQFVQGATNVGGNPAIFTTGNAGANNQLVDYVTSGIQIQEQTMFVQNRGNSYAGSLNIRSHGTETQSVATLSAGKIILTTPTQGTAGLIQMPGYGANAALTLDGGGGLIPRTLTNGQILVGSTNATPVAANITAGAGISITNAPGSITIANNGTTAPGLSGIATLNAGTVTVNTTAVTAASKILLTTQNANGTQGLLRIGTITPGTSFVINSSTSLDTSTVAYLVIN